MNQIMKSSSMLYHDKKQVLFISYSLAVIFFLPSIETLSDHSSLVYKNCTNQTFSMLANSQSLSNLFQELVSHSSKSKFFKTSKLSNEEKPISGLYQCRGDINNEECSNCVNSLPDMSNNLCKEARAARVQLNGCYMRYEPEGGSKLFDHDHHLLHKTCGERNEVDPRFEDIRAGAFATMKGAIAGGDRFYKSSYLVVEVMAQCVEDWNICECSECVNYAVQIAEEECGEAFLGEFYLDKCFLSYSYNPHRPQGHSGRIIQS